MPTCDFPAFQLLHVAVVELVARLRPLGEVEENVAATVAHLNATTCGQRQEFREGVQVGEEDEMEATATAHTHKIQSTFSLSS